ncbi:hypothetical protein NW761_000456 [Fusarium oxysporum]|nr:hypothetical protein NW753_013833 [Fusarium oxysporum]KAJ4054871.1 hypothetical protein NW758_002571 [Fusarium oxysporum]KAJ4074165.1 hypothetical protein NW756_013952 [Fusarium oxysporum]KAJ4106581.1 hypothetical protein NW761_000456 [Fusarium oxysporum]
MRNWVQKETHLLFVAPDGIALGHLLGLEEYCKCIQISHTCKNRQKALITQYIAVKEAEKRTWEHVQAWANECV